MMFGMCIVINYKRVLFPLQNLQKHFVYAFEIDIQRGVLIK